MVIPLPQERPAAGVGIFTFLFSGHYVKDSSPSGSVQTSGVDRCFI